ncbi:SDR1 [Symbiodinium natans]|uniref:SDR1 protein n=1 Tax=Symbiodinium natans TaxID=878477 RepID=A0A812VA10_9DINO|nr:SDR1 [Symbiodinium natans]
MSGFRAVWFRGDSVASYPRTLDVNLFGAQRLTKALLPELLDEKAPGRLVFVSSGAGTANLSKMSEERRQELLECSDLSAMAAFCSAFVAAYEASAREQEEQPLPHLSSGFWLQSYGFSKACLNRYCQIMAQQHPGLSCVACSPGFVDTEMVKTYRGDAKLKSVEEGGDVCAWLACSPAIDNGYYNPDRSMASAG